MKEHDHGEKLYFYFFLDANEYMRETKHAVV